MRPLSYVHHGLQTVSEAYDVIKQTHEKGALLYES